MKIKPWSGVQRWGLLAAWVAARIYAAEPEFVAREEGLRTVDTVELLRNGIYWWTASSCSGDIANPGGASYIAYTDPRLLSAGVTRFSARPAVSGGFQPGDALDLGISLTGPMSALRGVLLPDCAYGAHFVRDDEAFYYASNRVLNRKPLTARSIDPGETLRFRVALERLPVAADGVLFANERELWFYSADLPRNTLTIQRLFKPETKDFSPPREIVTLPGVAVRKFALVDIQGTDGSYVGSEQMVLLPDGSLYRTGVTPGSAATLIRKGVADFAIRNEVYTVRGNLGLVSRRRATTVYLALGNPITHAGEGQLLGVDLTPGARGTFVEFNAGANFRVTSVAVDKRYIFLTRTPVSAPANSDLLRRSAPGETSVANPGEPDYSTVALAREFRSLRSTGRLVYFAHGNTIQRVGVNAPAIAVDFEAMGLEVTQEIQNLDNTVPLVARKGVWVRGYAKLAADSTGQGSFGVPAHLRVSHAPKVDIGQALFTEVAGSPFLPVREPPVTNVTALASLRTNPNATYLFEVPESVISEGDLQFEFVLNPGRVVPETGLNPLANNRAQAVLKTRETIAFPLTLVPMKYKGGFYDRNSDPQFWNIIARAVSLLPVPSFQVFFRAGMSYPLSDKSFELPDQKGDALATVTFARVLDDNPIQGPYVGIFPHETTNFNGLGQMPGRALIIRMGRDLPSAWNTPRGGVALAHEFSHNTGFKHVNTSTNCTTQAPDGPFDVIPGSADGCSLGATDLNLTSTSAGYDPISGRVVLPASNGDLMSYANTRWTSEANWKRLWAIYSFRLPPPASVGQISALNVPAGEFLIVQGVYRPDENSASLLPAHTLSGAALSQSTLAELTEVPPELPPNYPFRLQLLDGDGQVLVDEPAPLSDLTETNDELLNRAVPFADEARMLRFMNGDTVLSEIAISASAPEVELAPPAVANGQLSVSWNASTADAQPAYSTVQLSIDGGTTWQGLAYSSEARNLTLDTRRIPGGADARIRLVVSDGARAAITTSAPFALPKHPPEVSITGVAEGENFELGAAPAIRGFAYDLEDGSLSNLLWNLTGPVSRQVIGESFSIADLPPGAYELSLTATDADGETATRSVHFTLRALVVNDAVEPVLDGLCDPAYAASSVLRLPMANGTYATVRLLHANGALFACFTGLNYGSGSVAGLRINSDGSGQTAAVTAGFAVNQHGEPVRVQGTGDDFSVLASPPAGFTAVILRDENAWNAELRISDELLGGWSALLGLVAYADDGAQNTPPITWPPAADINHPGSWAASSAGPLPPVDPPVDPPGPVELVQNGGFEDVGGTFEGGALSIMSLLPGSSAIPGWEVQGAELAWVSNANPYALTTPEGNLFLDLTGFHDGRPYGAVQQQLATEPGAAYRLTVAVGASQEVGPFFGPMTVGVVINDTTNLLTFTPLPRPIGDYWHNFETEFTALAESTRITLSGASTAGGAYIGLDNVTLTKDGQNVAEWVNGSFEDVEGGFSPDGSGIMALLPDSTLIPGWTTVHAELAWAVNTNTYGARTPDGSYFLDLTGYHDSPPYGGVTQTVQTVPNQTYKMSFSVASFEGAPNYRGPVAVAVAIDSATNVFTFAAPGSGTQWGDLTIDFQAASDSTRLLIFGERSTGGGFLGLDRVSVVRTGDAVPTLELRVSQVTDADLHLAFATEAGRTYEIESTPDLSSQNWTTVPGISVAGTGNVEEVALNSSLTGTQQFFRLKRL